MKDRLITLAGAAAALYVVATLLAPPQRPEPLSVPTTQDDGPHGLLGLQRWLSDGGVPTHSLRRRYDALHAEPTLAERGNLLIISLPQRIQARSRERAWLRQWIAAGNSALILAAHGDRPDWARDSTGFGNVPSFEILFDLGFYFEPVEVGETEGETPSILERLESDAGNETHLKPRVAIPVLRGVQGVYVRPSPLLDGDWRLASREAHRGTVALLEEPDRGAPVLWQVRVGEGRAWISRFADVFSNGMLNKEDNAQLVANFANASLGEEGSVIFDDMHAGLTDLYDAKAFFGDPRLHNTLWFVLVFWLIYVLGHSNRLGPAIAPPSAPRASDFVEATGGLFARRLPRRTVGNGLIRHFFNEVRAQYGMPLNGEPVWSTLSRSPRLPADALKELKRFYSEPPEERKYDLVRLQNLLRTIRDRLI